MKAGFFVAAAVAQIAIAQPHLHHRHQHLHEKRDVVTVVDVVTAASPDVVVFVNQYGEPVSTSYVNPYLQQQKTTASSSHAHAHSHSHSVQTHSTSTVYAPVEPTTTAATVESTSQAPVETPTTTPTTTAAATTLVTTSAAAATTSSSSGSTTGSTGYGLTYSPYNSDGSCKSQAQVSADFEQLDNYGLVRMYGTDCDQLNTIGSAATTKGMKLFVGVYDLSTLSDEIALIVAYANGNWDNFDTISIGNELVNSGSASVSDVVSAVNTARSLLTAAGYTGSVVTVDTYVAVLNNPELCEVSDYAAVNAHAFFDSDTLAQNAGTFVSGVASQVETACGKKTIVTESGWPSSGEANGVAVPSPANQAAAISSLKKSFSADGLILFTAYNDFWKTNFAGSFEAEQYWGIYGTSSQ